MLEGQADSVSPYCICVSPDHVRSGAPSPELLHGRFVSELYCGLKIGYIDVVKVDSFKLSEDLVRVPGWPMLDHQSLRSLLGLRRPLSMNHSSSWS